MGLRSGNLVLRVSVAAAMSYSRGRFNWAVSRVFCSWGYRFIGLIALGRNTTPSQINAAAYKWRNGVYSASRVVVSWVCVVVLLLVARPKRENNVLPPSVFGKKGEEKRCSSRPRFPRMFSALLLVLRPTEDLMLPACGRLD